MKLLLDENLPARLAAELRAEGYDALAAVEAGLGGAPDEAVRDFAVEIHASWLRGMGIFSNLLRFPTVGTPGVIRLKLHPPTHEGIVLELRRCLQVLKGVDLRGKLAVVQKGMIRIRG